MLDINGLKEWLHRDLIAKDKLLLVLATYSHPAQIAKVRQRASEAGFRIPNKWNVSAIFARSGGLAIRVPDGWELTETGRTYLHNLGVESVSPAWLQVATDLRAHLQNIGDPITRAFVEEAIKCHEAKLFRSAIVMSWIASIGVLYRVVVEQYLLAFNTEAQNRNPKWKHAINEDGLSRMREAEFLDILVPIGVIGKNVKDELSKALNLRNGCGHPNSLRVGPSMVNNHIETLLLNVFEPFSG